MAVLNKFNSFTYELGKAAVVVAPNPVGNPNRQPVNVQV